MIKCIKCNRGIPNDALLCPYCGTRITDRQRIVEKVYNKSLNNLKQFIIKAPIDIKKTKVINWSREDNDEPSKKPKAFYIIIFTMFITLSIVITFLLF